VKLRQIHLSLAVIQVHLHVVDIVRFTGQGRDNQLGAVLQNEEDCSDFFLPIIATMKNEPPAPPPTLTYFYCILSKYTPEVKIQHHI